MAYMYKIWMEGETALRKSDVCSTYLCKHNSTKKKLILTLNHNVTVLSRFIIPKTIMNSAKCTEQKLRISFPLETFIRNIFH
jgi:hypothetical protein